MSAIPVDVMVDILCKLPVKSLLRFKCLSKQFRSIIDNPDFIKRHLQNRSLDPSLIVEDANRNLFSLDLDSVDNAFKLELPFVSWGYGRQFNVIGSCDGLLALSHGQGISISLCNISTRKYQTLPNFLSIFDGIFYAYHGFGHDSASDDYKVVRIINSFEANLTEVSVYSLKGNCWRRIDGFPPYSRYYFHGMAAFVEGTLNWMGKMVEVEDRRETLIVSFDLKSEKFFEVPLPDTIREAKFVSSVMVLRGCLCLSCIDPFFRASDIIWAGALHIWVMKEYGMKESWTKLVSLSGEKLPRSTMISTYPEALVYSKHGDNIFIFQTEGDVLRYDLEKEKAENVEINGWPTTLISSGSGNIYVDSLVSPNVNE